MFSQHTIAIVPAKPSDALQGHIHAIYVTAETGLAASPSTSVEPNAPIVLLHDSLGSVGLWKDFPQQLANTTQRAVIAYDRLGFGQSSPRKDTLKKDFILAEAEHIMPQLLAYFKVERFIVLGHSVGGAIACATASLYPNRCVGLIAISTQAFNDEQILASIKNNYASFAEAKNFARLARYHGERTRWVLDAWAKTWQTPDFKSWSLLSMLAPITCPALVMQGADDEYNTTQHSKTLSDAIANSTLTILPNTGHFPHRQQQSVVLQAIDAFVAPLA